MHKHESISLSVLPNYKVALRAVARLEGEPMSVVIRRLIRQEAHFHGVWIMSGEDLQEVNDDIAQADS